MAERDIRERDILVAPNEYSYVQDLTKGDIVLYVGPTKISLSNTERLTVFREGRFVPLRGEEAGLGVHSFVEATSSQYIILENPPADAAVVPVKGANSSTQLLHGRKIVVPGPAQFPLWPGQRAMVIDGHELHADEYLVTRVYDRVDGDDSPIGTENIVRGTALSFYMPSTGLEVVAGDGSYVRKAIRLEKHQGLHLRFISDFNIESDDLLPNGQYRAGQELFIRDREGYFFPISDIEVIGLVERIPVADKEGLYVRNFESGEIATIAGPVNFLADPTREEVVHRELEHEVEARYGLELRKKGSALSIYVPPSSSVMVTGTRRREVVIGPQSLLLDYNDELEELQLSTGRPKSDDQLLTTCFLQIDGNKVSDLVSVKTRDHVELDISLSYRVSFTGESEKWFAVKNYVGLLCDHLGSIIRAAARSATIERFHESSTELLRGAILGPRTEDGKRAGRHFGENGMWVYDVEVLDVNILDCEVKTLLTDAQRTAIVSEITRKAEELRLGDARLRESVNREIYGAQMATLEAATGHETARRGLRLAEVQTEMDAERMEMLAKAEESAEALRIQSSAELDADERRAIVEKKRLDAESAAFREKMQALAPELIATLKTLGNQKLAGELSANLSPLAILGGESVADVAGRLLERLPLGASAKSVGSAASVASLLLSESDESS